MWRVEYAQCPRGNTWAFKFDHIPREDGRWRPIRSDQDGVYRVEDDVFQFCAADTHVPGAEWEQVLNALRECGPFRTMRTVEVMIARDNSGFAMWPQGENEDASIRFTDLTLEALRRAHADLEQRA